MPSRRPYILLPVLLGALAVASPALAAPAGPPARDSVVVLDTAQGRIVIRLAAREAPAHAANFRRLVARGFYDGTCFHRVVPGFVIQGGDPNSRDADAFNDGQGGPGWTLPAEIGLPHVRGAVAAARMPDSVNPSRASNGSQFYICVADRPDLDRGGYTVFGRVIAGMDVVDRIVALAERKDIARLATGANPQQLALVRHASLEPAPRAPVKLPAKPAATPVTR